MISEPSNVFAELKKLSQQMKNLSLYILRNPLTVAESRTTSFFHWLRKPQQNKCAVKYFFTGVTDVLKRNSLTFQNLFRDLSLESRNIHTQCCVPIQCKVWPRNEVFDECSFHALCNVQSVY